MKTKAKYSIQLLIAFVTMLFLNSCEVVGGIFKTGMGVGAIMVILVIGLIIFLLTRMGKK